MKGAFIMKKSADSLRKTLAFTAALLFVSSSFAGYPVNTISTVYAVGSQSANRSALALTYSFEISNEDINETFAEIDFYEFVNMVFGDNNTLTINPEKHEVTVTAGMRELENQLYFGDKMYKLNSNMNGVITYDAYYKVYDNLGGDSRVSLNFDDYCFTDDGFCKAGSPIYITPSKIYSYNNSDEPARVTNNGILSFDIADGENDSFTVNVTDSENNPVSSYDFALKTFSIEADSKFKLQFDGKPISPVDLKWKDINRLSLVFDDVQAVIVSDGTTSRTVTIKEHPFYLFHIFEGNELSGYVSGATYSIEAINNAVRSITLIDGKTSDNSALLPIEKDSDGYFIKVPYVIGNDCWLNGYTYNGNNELSASDVFEQLASGNQYLRLDHIAEKDIVLNYTSFKKSSSNGCTIGKSIVKRSEECCVTDSFTNGNELLNFSDKYDSSLLVLNYLNTSGSSYSLNSDSMLINGENRSFIPDSSKYANARYITAKSVISLDVENNSLVNSLDHSIYFLKDSMPPELILSDTEKFSDVNWIDKDSGTFTLSISDNIILPVDKASQQLTAENAEILAAYNDIFSGISGSNGIASLVIGNYVFDVPANLPSGKIEGRYESDEYRNARNALAEAVLHIKPSSLRSSFSDNKQSAYALANDIPLLESALKNPENVSSHDLDELRRLFNAMTAANNKKAPDYTVSLTHNSKSSDYTVSVALKDTNISSIVEKDLVIYAEDFCGNTSTPQQLSIRMDDSVPTIKPENINVTNTMSVPETHDNVLVPDSKIEVIVDETGSGIDKVLFSFDGKPDMEMQDMGGGVFQHILTKDDFENNNSRSPISVIAIDKAGNKSNIVSSLFNVVMDSIPPKNTLEVKSSPAYTDSYGEKWYGGFASAALRISSDDSENSFHSGIKNIEITINGHLSRIELNQSNINSQSLADGKYYIAFEQKVKNGPVRAVLKNEEGSAFSLELCSNVDMSKGKIDISYNSFDFAENKGNEVTESIHIDSQKPQILSIVQNTKNITGTFDNINYSVFSDTALNITVNASDGIQSSGLKEINVILMNANGTEFDRKSCRFDQFSTSNKFNVTVPLNFKGYIIAEAVDNAGLVSDKAYSYGIITENTALSNESSDIKITLPSTPYTDIFGNPLYKNDVTAHISASNSFSGISEAELKGSGITPQHITVFSDGELSGDEAELWNVTSENGLVSEISRDVKITHNGNNNQIEMSLRSNANRSGQPVTETSKFSIDRSAPKVSVSFSNSADPNEMGIFNESVYVYVTVQERNFSPDLASVKVNGTKRNVTWYLIDGTEGTDSAKYRAEVLFSADGNYRVTAECSDMCGWESAKAATNSFIIDRTPPEVHTSESLSNEPDHNYNQPFTATFSIVDNNFNPDNIKVSGTLDNRAEDFPQPSGWVKSGDRHTTTIDFKKDGEYTLSITGKDSAGNDIPEYDNSFRIDSEKPYIDIQDVQKANNAEIIQPRLIYTDRFLDKNSISIKVDGAKRGNDLQYSGKFSEVENGWQFVFDNLPNSAEYDDIYTITTSVMDNAGNVSMDIFQFSVNRFGSTFMLSDATAEISGRYISEVPDIIIREVNVDKHSDTYSVIVKKDGEIHELMPETDYKIEYSTKSDVGWSEYKYTIPAERFDEEAEYDLSVHSVDRAGNVNTSDSAYKFKFIVDKTAPVCTSSDIENDTVYKGKSHTFTLNFTDNNEIEDVNVLVNGYVSPRYYKDGKCTFEIEKSTQPQLVHVEVIDKAGNKTNLSYKNVLVTNNLFKYTSHQTWFRIIFGTIGAAAAGIGAFIFCKKRKEKNNLW